MVDCYARNGVIYRVGPKIRIGSHPAGRIELGLVKFVAKSVHG